MAFKRPLCPSQTTTSGSVSCHMRFRRKSNQDAWHSREVGAHETGCLRMPSPAMRSMHRLGTTEVASNTNTRGLGTNCGLGGFCQKAQNHAETDCTLTPFSDATSVSVDFPLSHRTNENNRARTWLSLRFRTAFLPHSGHLHRFVPDGCVPQRCICFPHDGHRFLGPLRVICP